MDPSREDAVGERWQIGDVLRGKTAGTALAVATLLGVVCLASPASVSAGRTFPANVREARAYAERKIGHAQFQCLDQIAERESHWNPTAGHAGGPWGIPQAFPGSKMGVGWRDDPMVQVRWMIRYVSERYGSACKAWEFWQRTGYY